jgi:hypothetical protein
LLREWFAVLTEKTKITHVTEGLTSSVRTSSVIRTEIRLRRSDFQSLELDSVSPGSFGGDDGVKRILAPHNGTGEMPRLRFVDFDETYRSHGKD